MNASNETTAATRLLLSVRAVLLVAVSSILLLASYVAVREFDQGRCLYVNWGSGNTVGDPAQFIFQTTFGLLFLLSFLCLGAGVGELVGSRLRPGMAALYLSSAGAVIALLAYGFIAVATWSIDPAPNNSDVVSERYLSFFWPIGLLQRSGNFSPTLCGE
jgi:TM2 domain-containing membrane protein YozV